MNGGTGKEREERAVDALLISALRQMDDDETDINEMSLPSLSEEERAAMNALGSNFIQRLLAGERPLPAPREEPPAQGLVEVEGLAPAGSSADYCLNRAEEVDDETARELEQREREILDRKARERKEGGGGDVV